MATDGNKKAIIDLTAMGDVTVEILHTRVTDEYAGSRGSYTEPAEASHTEFQITAVRIHDLPAETAAQLVPGARFRARVSVSMEFEGARRGRGPSLDKESTDDYDVLEVMSVEGSAVDLLVDGPEMVAYGSTPAQSYRGAL